MVSGARVNGNRGDEEWFLLDFVY